MLIPKDDLRIFKNSYSEHRLPNGSQRTIENTNRSRKDRSQNFKEMALAERWVEKCIANSTLSYYFKNLQQLLTPQAVETCKKYCILDQGVYILLSGRVAYSKVSRCNERDKRIQLLNLAKAGYITQLNKNPFNPDPQLLNGYCIMLNESFSIFQCDQEDVMTMQETQVIKISEQVRERSKFDELKKERIELCENSYLRGQLNTENGSIFTVNHHLHSTFKFRKATFGAKLKLPTLAIIKQGSLKNFKPPSNPQSFHQSNTQIERFGIIVPKVEYEVSSTQLIIMTIESNPTLCYWSNCLKQELFEERILKIPQKMQQKKLIKGHRLNKMNKSAAQYRMGRREKKLYHKNLSEISQKCENYIMVTMNSCQQELSSVRKKVLESRKNIDNQSKYKIPTVLFDFHKTKTNKVMPSLKRVFEQNLFCRFKNDLQRQNAYKKERRTANGKYLSYFRNYSKQLSGKFQKSQIGEPCEPRTQNFENVFQRIKSYSRSQNTQSLHFKRQIYSIAPGRYQRNDFQ